MRYTDEQVKRAVEWGASWLTTDRDGTVTAWKRKPGQSAPHWFCRLTDGREYMVLRKGDADCWYDGWRNSLESIAQAPGTGRTDSVQYKEPTPDRQRSLYLDVMQRLSAAVDAGKLPADTFRVLWGDAP